jgi:hypothetical protein
VGAVKALALALLLALPAGALAARQPTFKEREALTGALPAAFQRYPVGCVWLKVAVSSSGRYATVEPAFLNALRNPCLKYASNGLWILKKTGARWKIVFNGSDAPPCSLGAPKDLVTGCARR